MCDGWHVARRLVLCGTGAEEHFMWLKWLGNVAIRRVEAQSDSFCVLIGGVGSVAQVHEELIAVPP